ncbi:MAG: hypothetical protein QXG39_04960 [Candidatus Aenigmatarchaeota archaeon]
MKKFLFFTLFFISYLSGDAIDKLFSKIAKSFAKEIPKGKIAVVVNFKRFGDHKETKLGIYLAKKFSACLGSKAIRRGDPEELMKYEMEFTFSNPDPRSLSKKYEAEVEYFVYGEYELEENKLRIVELKLTREFDLSPIKVEMEKIVKLSESDFKRFSAYDCQVITPPPEYIQKIFDLGKGEWNAVKEGKIVDINNCLLNSDTLVSGSYYRLKLSLNEPCYLYIFGYDIEDNLLNLIHPIGVSPFQNKKEVTIPVQENRALRAVPPPAKRPHDKEYNWILIVATKKELGMTFPVSEENPYLDEETVKKLNEILIKFKPKEFQIYRVDLWIRNR